VTVAMVDLLLSCHAEHDNLNSTVVFSTIVEVVLFHFSCGCHHHNWNSISTMVAI